MARQKKKYYVKWFTSGGFNYRDTSDVDWEGVKHFKKVAKALGEKIEYEVQNW